MIGAGKAQMYVPKAKEVQELDVKKHKGLINQILLLLERFSFEWPAARRRTSIWRRPIWQG